MKATQAIPNIEFMHHTPAEVRIFTRERVRALDQASIERFGLPGIVLMENAAAAIEEVSLSLFKEEGLSFTLIVCGPGNNGGDGLALARRLANRRCAVGVALAAQPRQYKGDALTNLRIVETMNLPIHIIDTNHADESLSKIMSIWTSSSCRTDVLDDVLIVDALFGTGLDRAIAEPAIQIVRWINAARSKGATVLAVDIPSGLDCDTGQPAGGAAPEGVVSADCTVTLAGLKRGMLNASALRFTGSIYVGDIGLPLSLLREFGEPWTGGSPAIAGISQSDTP